MKSLILTIVVLTGGALLALFVQKDPGYVLFGYQNWTVEMSLMLFGFALLITVAVAHYLFRVLGGVTGAPRKIKRWRRQRVERNAHKTLTKGLLELAEGQWKKAEKSLLSYVKESHNPRPAYLAAAKVAQAQGALDRRDHYLKLAHEATEGQDMAVQIIQAELRMDNGQLEQALATLVHLRRQYPRNDRILVLLAVVYERLGDWKNLIELLPELSKKRVFSPPRLAELEEKAYAGSIDDAAKAAEPTHLHNAWNRLPKHLRSNDVVLTRYLGYIIERGEHAIAEPLLRAAIKRRWNERFMYMYGLLKVNNTTRALEWAEGFLKSYENNSVLLLTLGRLAMNAHDSVKARTYLEAAAERGSTPESYYNLAKLLEQAEEPEKASEYYRRGLELASNLRETTELNFLEAAAARA